MLTQQKVLAFVKRKLGYPNVIIELSDETILEHMEMFTLTEFSKYIPDDEELVLDTELAENKTEQSNVFYLHDRDECDILSVSDVIFPHETLYLINYPYVAPITQLPEVPNQLLQMLNAENAEQFSNMLSSFEFWEPNRLRIYCSMIPSKLVVRYQRVHPATLESIPVEYQPEFQYLLLADVMSMCGGIRNKYASISTPFGDVQLGADLGSAGDALKEKILDKLDASPPNAILFVG